jgi:hypothetical protein
VGKKMKKNRHELELALIKVMTENNSNSKIRKQLSDGLTKRYNINPSIVNGLLNGTVLLRTLGLTELCLLCSVLHEVTGSYLVNPDLYFEVEEIKTANNFKIEKQTGTNIIVLNNVKQIGDHQYICSYEPWSTITQHTSIGNITYNIRTQRGAKLKKMGDTIVEVAKLDEMKIESIKKLMLENKFTANMIALNIVRNGEEIFEYDAKKATISIQVDNIKTNVNLVDGAHRTYAALKAVAENPNLALGTAINILNYTEEEAQAFIKQESEATPIIKQVRVSFDTDNENIVMARYLNSQGNEKTNEMFNKIATTNDEIKYYGKYTTFEIISKSLGYSFKFETARERESAKKFLVAYFVEVIGIIKELENFEEVKQVLLSPNIFVGYVEFASKIYKKENWQSDVENMIRKISKLNCKNMLENIPLGNIINTATLKKIAEYFTNLNEVSHER